MGYFNPRAPCGARRSSAQNLHNDLLFQPTRPLRGATISSRPILATGKISTHAPLAGRDISSARCQTSFTTNFNPRAPCGARRVLVSLVPITSNFNPRAPCGARPRPQHLARESLRFQPTRPLRGATIRRWATQTPNVISTRAPLAGRDVGVVGVHRSVGISTHAPLAGRDAQA